MGTLRKPRNLVALLLLGAAIATIASVSIVMITTRTASAQVGGGDGVVTVPILDHAFEGIDIDDECLITNRRELEGPIENAGVLRFQGVMVITSVCPEDSGAELQTEVQIFSVLCAKDVTLDTHAICDVKLVAQERVESSGGGGSGGGGSGRGR